MQAALHNQKRQAFIENRLKAYRLIEDVLALDVEAKQIGLGGMQEAECSDAITMLIRMCTNHGIEVRGALSRMRATLDKL
jgi:hypothetical protein